MPIEMTHTAAKQAPPRKSAKAAPVIPPSPGEMMGPRAEAVNGLFQLGQSILLMANQYADAAAIGMHGPNISRELVSLAETNETIGRGIDFLLTAGPYAGLVTAILPLGLQIATNHGRIPEVGIPGVLSPKALEAKMKAEAQAVAARAMQDALEAQQMADRAQADLDAAASANGQQKRSQGRAEATKETPAK